MAGLKLLDLEDVEDEDEDDELSLSELEEESLELDFPLSEVWLSLSNMFSEGTSPLELVLAGESRFSTSIEASVVLRLCFWDFFCGASFLGEFFGSVGVSSVAVSMG